MQDLKHKIPSNSLQTQDEENTFSSGEVFISIDNTNNYIVDIETVYKDGLCHTTHLKLPLSAPKKKGETCITIDNLSVKKGEEKRKRPRNTDNNVQIFTFIFNALVIVFKVFLGGSVLNILLCASSIFSILAGLAGSWRSGNGWSKSRKNQHILTSGSQNRSIDYVDQRSKDIRDIEKTDVNKHFERLILDVGLIAVGILGIPIPAIGLYLTIGLYFTLASVVFIFGFSVASLFAMVRKYKISRNISNCSNNNPDNEPDLLNKSLTEILLKINGGPKCQKQVLEFIKKSDKGYYAERTDKVEIYSGETIARLLVAAGAICLALLTINNGTTIALIVISILAAVVTVLAKIWFWDKSRRNGDKRTETVINFPQGIREILIKDSKISDALVALNAKKKNNNAVDVANDSKRQDSVGSPDDSIPKPNVEKNFDTEITKILEYLQNIYSNRYDKELVQIDYNHKADTSDTGRLTIKGLVDLIKLQQQLAFIQRSDTHISLDEMGNCGEEKLVLKITQVGASNIPNNREKHSVLTNRTHNSEYPIKLGQALRKNSFIPPPSSSPDHPTHLDPENAAGLTTNSL